LVLTFISNGLDQRVVDLSLRPNAPLNNDVYDVSGRTLRDISEITGRVCNIVFAGQSTNNNSVQGMTTPVHPTKIFNLSVAHPMTTQIYQAKEPLLCSDLIKGHHGIAYADGLISGGYVDNVVLTPISLGGSYAADFAPGGGTVGGNYPGVRAGSLSYRIGLAARSIEYAGLSHLPTIIDWQQGEWDSDATPTTYANYKAALQAVIAEFGRVGLLRPGNMMVIHRSTRITNPAASRDIIRQAQADVVGGLVRAGADIDTLGSGYRYDTAHFTAEGAAAQAALKIPIAADFLANG
jgi:hypothetical protein